MIMAKMSPYRRVTLIFSKINARGGGRRGGGAEGREA
jgi:hypothetical protein